MPLTYQTCTKAGGCQDQRGEVVLDANWRWTHNVGGYTNCYTGTTWDSSFCPDNKTCAENCALDGVDENTWRDTYGVTAEGNKLRLGYVTHTQYGDNVGSRTYLMDSESHYLQFKLKNTEFTFDVDVSDLPCGLNGALYFAGLDADGGTSKYPSNKAGAKYGTGYCDAQCPHDIKFIAGEANVEGWNSTTATGKYGSCCMEMDIWEANKESQAYTAHPCSVAESTRCEGLQCGDGADRQNGACDKDGCDLAQYRNGNTDFYGPGSQYKIDTTKPLTVVTQFITEDGTDNTDVKEIRRKYLQGGTVVENQPTTFAGKAFDSLTDDFCDAAKTLFTDPKTYQKLGGMKQLGGNFDKGMTLVMSLWDDSAASMLWLDSQYPVDADPSKPGVTRGPCGTDTGKPEDERKLTPNSYVAFSNIRYGEIDSTYSSNDMEVFLQ